LIKGTKTEEGEEPHHAFSFLSNYTISFGSVSGKGGREKGGKGGRGKQSPLPFLLLREKGRLGRRRWRKKRRTQTVLFFTLAVHHNEGGKEGKGTEGAYLSYFLREKTISLTTTTDLTSSPLSFPTSLPLFRRKRIGRRGKKNEVQTRVFCLPLRVTPDRGRTRRRTKGGKRKKGKSRKERISYTYFWLAHGL